MQDNLYNRYAGYYAHADKISSMFPIFSTFTGATLGASAGAGLGRSYGNTEKERIRNALMGVAIGGMAGGALGYSLGDMFKLDQAMARPHTIGSMHDVMGRKAILGSLSGGAIMAPLGLPGMIAGYAGGALLGAASAPLFVRASKYVREKEKKEIRQKVQQAVEQQLS